MDYSCICGNNDFTQYRKDYYKMTPEGITIKSEDSKVTFGRCNTCGVIRQTDSPLISNLKYEEFYREKYPPVNPVYVKKDYMHDRKLAEKRLNTYPSTGKDKILDIGSGSGAFVDECRARGIEAYGCEISKYAYANNDKFIYHQRFEEINFPTDYFSIVTCHDVLEHVIDPVKFVKEVFRITKQEGICIIDFPDYFIEAGNHHWKLEHVWYFTLEELKRVLEKEGFKIQDEWKPIESKIVLMVTKPQQKRIKILVPPGIGDVYWSLVKMESFLQREKLGLPDIHIVSPRDKEFDAHKRAFPFLEMFPFLNSTGEVLDCSNDRTKRQLWEEAYKNKGRTIFKNIDGYDYFISYNGHLRHGAQLENTDCDLTCNWFPKMFVSLEQENYRKESMMKYGKYIVFYFVFQGTYSYWTKEFPVEKVIESIRVISEQTKCIPIITGAVWDNKSDSSLDVVKRKIPGCIDLTGKTSVEQLFGLIRGSEMIIGYPSGLTILSAVLKKKTLIIWNDYYNRDFFWYCAPPSVRENTYFIANTNNLTPDSLTNQVKGLL